MKIFYSPASPYVRKCLVVAEELNLRDKIELLDCAAHPIESDQNIIKFNPLGQIPTFFTDDGKVLFDSFVICAYLNELAGGELLGDKENYWQTLKNHSIVDGRMNAALILRYETGAVFVKQVVRFLMQLIRHFSLTRYSPSMGLARPL